MVPPFPAGADYLFTRGALRRVGAGRSCLSSRALEPSGSLCTFRRCTAGLAQDRHQPPKALEGFPEFIPSTRSLSGPRHLFQKDESPALTTELQARAKSNKAHRVPLRIILIWADASRAMTGLETMAASTREAPHVPQCRSFTMTDEKISRRQLLQTALVGLAAVPATTLIARDAGADELLSESDPQAKYFGYVVDAARSSRRLNPTYKPGQHCANCLPVQAGQGRCGSRRLRHLRRQARQGERLVQGLDRGRSPKSHLNGILSLSRKARRPAGAGLSFRFEKSFSRGSARRHETRAVGTGRRRFHRPRQTGVPRGPEDRRRSGRHPPGGKIARPLRSQHCTTRAFATDRARRRRRLRMANACRR